jgi:tetratricopeptide (TPR) repeat protein
VRLAQSHLAAATEVAPDRPEAWLNLALCHEQTGAGDPEADFAAAAKAAAGDTARLNRVRWQRALWLDRRQPPQKTALRDELCRILADDPAFPDANGLLGQYLYDIADYDRALEHLERECARDPGPEPGRVWLESHYLVAVICTDHRPDAVKALHHAQEYYKRRPDAPKIHELRRRALRLSAAMGVAAEPQRGAASAAAVRPAAGDHGGGSTGHQQATAEPAPSEHVPAPVHAEPGQGPAPAHAPAMPAGGHH